jgi:hypothetical protein
MTYDVRWIQSALDDLADVWTKSDSTMRADINLAVKSLDQQLCKDPASISESRDAGEWICFSGPLAALIEIDSFWVLAVWRFR